MARLKLAPIGLGAVMWLSACSEPATQPAASAPPSPTPAAAPAVAGIVNPPSAQAAPAAGTLTPAAIQPSASPLGQAVNTAAFAAAGQAADAKRDMLVRAQVLLDRAHFSVGAIDGREGSNQRAAILAYEQAHGLPADGVLDEAVWTQLTQADGQPAVTDYVITEDDVKGPFLPSVPSDFKAMAGLDKLAYTSPRELLAERFHMDEALLAALNPQADFAKAGTTIVVVAPSGDELPAAVGKIEVDKSRRQVRAYGADGTLLAAYPATVGSTERPAPQGQWAVKGVAFDPTYVYDPKRLTFGDRGGGKFTIPAGPNNPVGAVWIDLTKETYGIHGSPDPRLVGKTASHGCVRLTNWDAKQLGHSVKPGTAVIFVGMEGPRKA